MTSSIMRLINEGDTVRLRNDTITTVDFIAHMPDDLINDYEYIVRLNGFEPVTYTVDGKFYTDVESNIDIMEVQG